MGLTKKNALNPEKDWAYQDFSAGSITTTSVTLTVDQNGDSSNFNSNDIINGYAFVSNTKGEDLIYSGAIRLFSTKVSVSNQDKASLTLNAVPNSSWGTVRIWYLRTYPTGIPSNHLNAPEFVKASQIVTLDNLFITEEEMTAHKSSTDHDSHNDSRLDTDGTLAANSDSKTASQKAVKTYVDTFSNCRKSYRLFDDFFVNPAGLSNGMTGGVFGFYLGTVSGSFGYQSASIDAPGVVYYSTGADPAGRSGMLTGNTSILFGGGSYSSTWRTKLLIAADETDAYLIRVGFIDTTVTAPTDGAYFHYSRLNNGHYVCITRSNSTETATETDISPTLNGWDLLRVDINAAGTEAKFYINDVLKATHNTNIPTGSGRQTGMGVVITKTAGTTARSLELDYVLLDVNLTNSR